MLHRTIKWTRENKYYLQICVPIIH